MCCVKALASCFLNAVSSAANMRSFLQRSLRSRALRRVSSAPCLTLTGTRGASICYRCRSYASTFLPPFPGAVLLPAPFALFRRFGTMKALTPALLTHNAGLPAYLVTPSCRSVSNHVGCLSIATPRLRAQRFSDFAMNEQARHSSPPNRVRSPTDQLFASGCSPPRLAATQLPSATRGQTLLGEEFHLADTTTSQAH